MEKKPLPEDDLWVSLERGDYRHAQQIIEANRLLVSAHAKQSAMATPLHFAVMNHALDFASWLIRHGVDVNAIDLNGDTPLHTAVFFLNTQLIELLLQNGAFSEQKNHKGKTPLFLLAIRREEAVPFLDVFLNNGAQLDLNSAILVERIDRVNQLLQNNPGIIQTCLFPNRLLNDAIDVSVNDNGLIELLLSHGVSPNEHSDEYPFPLIQACSIYYPLPSVIQSLLKYGADVTIRDSMGKTALAIAKQ